MPESRTIRGSFLGQVPSFEMIHNVIVASGWRRQKEFGVPLEFREVIAHPKAIRMLYAVERRYPRVGKCMLATYFPGGLREGEEKNWKDFEEIAKRSTQHSRKKGAVSTNTVANNIGEVKPEHV